MEKANVAIIEQTLKDYIKDKANAHAEKYVERYKKVAYDSYLAGMEAMSLVLAFNVAFIIGRRQSEIPTALDVYRGKTTLEITYRDSVAIDSTVVYKVR